MAGGQERILRRRIKSVQSTRKITKAMELIAASQISARPGAHRREPALPRRHATHHRRGREGRPGRRAKLLATPEHVDRAIVLVVLTGDRGLSGAYNSRCCAPASGSCAKLEGEGIEASALQRRQEGGRLLPLPRHRGRARLRRHVGSPDLRRRPADRRDVAAPFLAGDAQQVLLGLDAIPLGGDPERRDVRQLLPLPDARRADDDEPSEGLKGYTEFEPEVEKLLTTLAPKALESRDLLRAPGGRGVVPRQPAARDGRRDRQRRRARPDLTSHHEPGPPGLDHHRNHGNRGRRRSAPLGKVRIQMTIAPEKTDARDGSRRRDRRSGRGRGVPAALAARDQPRRRDRHRHRRRARSP